MNKQAKLAKLEDEYNAISKRLAQPMHEHDAKIPQREKRKRFDSKSSSDRSGKATAADRRKLQEAKAAVAKWKRKVTGLRTVLQAKEESKNSYTGLVKIIMDTIRSYKGGMSPTLGLDENTLRMLQKHTSDDTVLGSLYNRVLGGQANAEFPPILLHFALTVANASASAYRQLQAAIPGLPSMSTVIRYRNTSAYMTGSTEMRLRLFSDERKSRNLSKWSCTGSLLVDEVSIQAVSIDFHDRPCVLYRTGSKWCLITGSCVSSKIGSIHRNG